MKGGDWPSIMGIPNKEISKYKNLWNEIIPIVIKQIFCSTQIKEQFGLHKLCADFWCPYSMWTKLKIFLLRFYDFVCLHAFVLHSINMAANPLLPTHSTSLIQCSTISNNLAFNKILLIKIQINFLSIMIVLWTLWNRCRFTKNPYLQDQNWKKCKIPCVSKMCSGGL